MKCSVCSSSLVLLTASLLGITTLTACDGNTATSQSDAVAAQGKRTGRGNNKDASTPTSASAYQTVVQQLYVSYFGRAADPGGLANVETTLMNANAPMDIQSLTAAYSSNAVIKGLIDSFGTSAESTTLYAGSNTTGFVTAIYQHVLGRAPATAGLNFWVNAITNGSLTQGNAALSIMAGALSNTSTQGTTDAQLIANRLAAASYLTAQLGTQNAVSAYSGKNAAAIVRTMLGTVDSTTTTIAFQSAANSAILNLEAATVPANTASTPSSPGATQIVFSGYTFNVRTGSGGPGPNTWSAQNAWVDANGFLHLKISNNNGTWNTAEIYTSQSFGFGSYQFKVVGHPETLDQNVVLGLFPYTTPEIGPDGTNEIDIEFATWGGAQTTHGNWTVWPAVAGNNNASYQFDMTPNNTGYSTHRFNWASQQISFQALTGLTDTNSGEYANWTFAPTDYTTLIPQNAIPLHLNFWLFNGQAPTNGLDTEIVISEFTYTP